MKIEISVDEIKELIKTPSAGTLDVDERVKTGINQLLRIADKEQLP